MKNLFKNSFLYVLGDILNKSIPFFMLPILTRYLTPEDYGIISIFTVLVSMFAVFTGLSIHGAINVNYFKLDKKELKVFIGNCILILNISTIILFFIIYLFYPFILEKLNIDIEWLFLSIVLAFAQFLTTINLLLWTAEQKPKEYTIYQVSQTLVITSISIILIIGFGMNWEGHLIAVTIGTLLSSIVSFIFIIKRGYLIFKPNKKYIKDALKFGIPLIPHSLAGWIKTGSDRLILMSILGMTATGIYTVAYQMGMLITIITVAFNKAWTPYLFKILSTSPTIEDKKKIVTFTYIYFLVILLLSLFSSYLLEYIIPYILGDKFIKSSVFIIYFFIANAFQGMYLMVTNYIFYVKKTYILAYVTFTTAIIHIILLYFLIDKDGIVGAAEATLISSIITFILVWIVSIKSYNMPWLIFK